LVRIPIAGYRICISDSLSVDDLTCLSHVAISFPVYVTGEGPGGEVVMLDVGQHLGGEVVGSGDWPCSVRGTRAQESSHIAGSRSQSGGEADDQGETVRFKVCTRPPLCCQPAPLRPASRTLLAVAVGIFGFRAWGMSRERRGRMVASGDALPSPTYIRRLIEQFDLWTRSPPAEETWASSGTTGRR
jgi:hypothetical protein